MNGTNIKDLSHEEFKFFKAGAILLIAAFVVCFSAMLRVYDGWHDFIKVISIPVSLAGLAFARTVIGHVKSPIDNESDWGFYNVTVLSVITIVIFGLSSLIWAFSSWWFFFWLMCVSGGLAIGAFWGWTKI